VERFSKPWLANDFILNLSPQGREYNRLLSTLHSFTRNVSHSLFLFDTILMLHFIYQVIAQRRESLKEMLDKNGQDVELIGPSN
jgi:hypothetical protein